MNIQEISWNYDTIADQNNYKLGMFPQAFGDFPKLVFNWGSDYLLTDFDPTAWFLSKKDVEFDLSYVPTNGLMAYYALSKSGRTSVAAGVKTIGKRTNLEQGESFNMRYNLSDGTNRHAYDISNCYIGRYGFQLNFASVDKVLTESIKGIGKNFASSAYRGDVASPHPDAIAESNRYPYAVDDNTIFTWDGDSLMGSIVDFNYYSDIALVPSRLDNNAFPSYVRTGNRQHVFGFTVKRDASAEVLAMFSDYVNQTVTGKDLRLKIFQNANSTDYYRDFTLSDSLINVQLPYADINNQDKGAYKVVGIARNTTHLEYDGVTPSSSGFYGVNP